MKYIITALKIEAQAFVDKYKLGKSKYNDEISIIVSGLGSSNMFNTTAKIVALMNDDDMPKLHINSYYKKAVSKGEKIAEETKTYLKDRLRSAEWLIKSIHQRHSCAGDTGELRIGRLVL